MAIWAIVRNRGDGEDDEDEDDDELLVLLWAARIAEEKSEDGGGGELDGSRRHGGGRGGGGEGGLSRFSSPKMSRTVASLLTCFFRDTSDSGSLRPPLTTSGSPPGPSSSSWL